MPDAPWLHGSVCEASCSRVCFVHCSTLSWPFSHTMQSGSALCHPSVYPQQRQQLRTEDLWRATEAWPCREVAGQPSHGIYWNGVRENLDRILREYVRYLGSSHWSRISRTRSGSEALLSTEADPQRLQGSFVSLRALLAPP